MASSDDYSFVDKAIHHMAFSTPFIHTTLSNLEDDLYRKQIKKQASGNEVFVTGLPRAGTTLLLEFLYSTGEFGTYTYRHMPFVRAPLLWQRMSKPFQRAAQSQERAHGDGMHISYDSPEAFEEIIWLHVAGKKFLRDDRLLPLEPLNNREMTEALQNSVTKLLTCEAGESSRSLRYLSKNNANISRLNCLSKLFPTGKVVVVVRDPLSHATSLLKQHMKFLERHQSDKFSRQYMCWLGHFDFGENFKPLDFDGWLDTRKTQDYTSIDFWLEYWIAAYSNVQSRLNGSIALINYNALLENGSAVLGNLGNWLELDSVAALEECASQLRAPTSRPESRLVCDESIYAEAMSLYAQLISIAL